MQPGHTLQHQAQGGDGGDWQVDVCGGDQEDDDFYLAWVCWGEWQPGGPQEARECVERQAAVLAPPWPQHQGWLIEKQ